MKYKWQVVVHTHEHGVVTKVVDSLTEVYKVPPQDASVFSIHIFAVVYQSGSPIDNLEELLEDSPAGVITTDSEFVKDFDARAADLKSKEVTHEGL